MWWVGRSMLSNRMWPQSQGAWTQRPGGDRGRAVLVSFFLSSPRKADGGDYAEQSNLVLPKPHALCKYYAHPLKIYWEIFINGTPGCTLRLWSELSLGPELLTSDSTHWYVLGGYRVVREKYKFPQSKSSQLSVSGGEEAGALGGLWKPDPPWPWPRNEPSHLNSVMLYVYWDMKNGGKHWARLDKVNEQHLRVKTFKKDFILIVPSG